VLIPPPATVTSSSSTSLAPVTPPRPPANPAPEVNSVIASYARAIESRDIAELRRVYPSITAAQRTAFEDFFRSTRSLSAVLAVSDLQVDGTNAEARVTGSYQFVTTAGATQRQPASFRATLRYEGGAWKLVAVR
jgi:hypothetical protein